MRTLLITKTHFEIIISRSEELERSKSVQGLMRVKTIVNLVWKGFDFKPVTFHDAISHREVCALVFFSKFIIKKLKKGRKVLLIF